MIFEKDFYSITVEDLEKLIDYEVPEDRYIDYKQHIPGNSYEDVKEFLADVSAFANASGGMILFGIDEENGVPVSIDGLDIEDVDSLILRLQDIIRSNTKPVVSQLHIRSIEVGDDKKVIIIRIPRSWSAPHVVKYKKHWRFHIRTSAGKHPMDIEEVRSSMLQSDSLSEKIKEFRDERLFLIQEERIPIQLSFRSPIILHLIPYSALYISDMSRINFKVIEENYHLIAPLRSSVSHSRYNLEGYLNYGHFTENGSCSGYVQIFRNGIIESVETRLIYPHSDNKKYVPSRLLEEKIIDKTRIYLDFQRKMGVLPPITMFVSLLNIRGYYLAVKHNLDRFGDRQFPLQREGLHLPELILEDYPDDVPSALRELFDSLWNAFGWDRSYDYGEDGVWNP